MSEYLSSKATDNIIIADENNVNSPIIVEEQHIRLLEEQLRVNLRKDKIGEVIVRKVVETEMVQIPIRREKLIIEQISPEQKHLAEIDLSQGEIAGVELNQSSRDKITSWNGGLTVSGNFSSPKIASLLLNAIALERNHTCQQVQVTIIVEDAAQQHKYQEWFDRCSHGQSLPVHPG
ncbi:YsnF/AvaK domain-containing protein [Nostoc sp. TCL26-01]|uniref:YsnF/AvaK domain-containing protein n=1 Tax=Nostoc sp. TCL26-01 TaxID=2576904 RepID=UPI0015C0A5DC|nr:DUF2382 domain-containing protein [Nostoc sp. TCL26-01]QLE54511.1 DUF2382 domain-containing protein [Nostoc sp. TCL26-01]